MSNYYGLEAISKRLTISRSQLLRWYKDRTWPFPMYSRQLKRRRVWYTNDAMILRWELGRCDVERNRRYGPTKSDPHANG